MRKQNLPPDGRDRDPAQRQRHNNVWASVRVLAILYLAYLIYQMIQGYRRGEAGMNLPAVTAMIAVFIAALAAIVVLSIRQWRRERIRVQQMWAERAEMCIRDSGYPPRLGSSCDSVSRCAGRPRLPRPVTRMAVGAAWLAQIPAQLLTSPGW